MAPMGDDLIPILTRFHREIVLPDIERVVGNAVGDLERRLNVHFDEIYRRLDRLEGEYHLIVAGLKRVEERLDRVEQRLEKTALKSELLALQARVDGLQDEIRRLQERVGA